MKAPRRALLLKHEDPLFRERVARCAKGAFELRIFDSWEALYEGIRSAPPAATILVDPLDQGVGSGGIAPELFNLLRLFPSATVLPALPIGPGAFDMVRRLGAAGVADVLCLDEDVTPFAIARRVENARGKPLRHLVSRALAPNTSATARSIIDRAVDVAVVGGGSEKLARALFTTPRTLLRWCRGSGLPAPRRLMLWLRLLLAAELLDDPGRTVLDVALSCGYSADGGLRNAIRASLDTTPGALRARGAFKVVSGRFLEALFEARTRRVVYRADDRRQARILRAG